MNLEQRPIVFGPVTSRRLGRSLGVTNIPPKSCTYACVYCQAGSTTRLTAERQTFYDPDVIAGAVRARLELAVDRGERVDVVTFVPEGEPTLDLGLGRAIRLIKRLGVRVAVLTNGTLLWRPEVRAALSAADWVSLKVDAIDEVPWRRVNRPCRRLSLAQVLDGQCDFAASFTGTLATETMMVDGVNDGWGVLDRLAGHVRRLQPDTAWVAAPVRPPAEPWVRPPKTAVLAGACETLGRHVRRVGCLNVLRSDELVGAGHAAGDLLAIAAVHPLRETAAEELLREAGADRSVLDALVGERRLVVEHFGGQRFFRAAAPAGGRAARRRPLASRR